MSRLLKLAWRDVWRNRRRSFLTIGAVLFAVLLISLANSVEYGTYDAMEEVVVRTYVSDLQIHRTGYQEEATLTASLEEGEWDWQGLPQAYPWITATARRLSGYGLASSDASSAGVAIVGIEPEAEDRITNFAGAPFTGRALEGADRGAVLVGEALAKNLDLALGDTLVLLTQGYQNVMGAELYTIQGLLRTGTPDLDRTLVVMPLADAQYLFSMEDRFTEFVVGTEDFRRSADYAAALQDNMPEAQYEVLDWRAMMPELEQMRALDDAGNYVFYFFLILLVGFEIFNTTTMSMMERVREFGVMMSIGVKPRQISLLVAMELSMKVLLALTMGFAITYAAVLLLSQGPIPLSEEMRQMYDDFGFTVEGIFFSARPVIFAFPMCSVAAVALASMVYPILRMRSFSPVDALRRT